MKSAHRVIAVLSITCCLTNGCRQDNFPTAATTPDAPVSQVGSGVLRANIDGLLWEAQDNEGIPSGTSTYGGNILHIRGVRNAIKDTARENANAESIDLIIDAGASMSDLALGTYALGTIPAQKGEAQYSNTVSLVFGTNSVHSGTVTIMALDLTRKVVAGTFAFNAIGMTGQTRTVSEGLFDVRWK
jgi:hypothetical protein